MDNEYRVYVSIRRRGQAPMDSEEFKSEACDNQDDYIASIAEFVGLTITEDEGNNDD